MKRRNLAAVMAALLVMTGCGAHGASGEEGTEEPGGKPDISSLMEGLTGIDSSAYNDIGVEMMMEGDVDGQEVHMSFTMGVESSGAVTHVYDGAIEMAMTGLTMSFGIESWDDAGTGLSYQNVTMLGQESGWMWQEAGSTTFLDATAFIDGSGALYDGTDYSLTGPHDGVYYVDWTVPGEKLAGVADAVGDEGYDMSFGDALARASFDSHTLKPIALTVSAGGSVDGAEAALGINLYFNELGGDKALSVPDDVVANAVSAGDVDLGMDGGAQETEFIESHGGKLMNDGAGSDDVIDGLGEHVASNDAGLEAMYLYHYEGADGGTDAATATWYTSRDGWHGIVLLDHVTSGSCDWFDPADSYTDTLAYLMQLYEEYEDPALVYQGDGQAVFLVDDNGGQRMELALYADGFYLEATAYCDSDDPMTEAQLAAALHELADWAGMDGYLKYDP